MINIKGYDIPTSMSEMTVKQFESLNKIMTNESSLQIERYVDYLESFIPSDDLYDVTDDEIFQLVEKVTKKEDISKEFIKEIEIDGYKYISHTDEFKISAVELSLIEKRINKNSSKYFTYIISVIFKREDLTNREHYTEAHLKYKEELFGELKADVFYPFVIFIADKLSKNLKSVYETAK